MRSDMTFSIKNMGDFPSFTIYRDFSKSSNIFNPYAYYEKVKFKNFQESSRLEGIQVDYSKSEKTLVDILNKYRR